jgi:DNA-binding XRE family transcriptional regulator
LKQTRYLTRLKLVRLQSGFSQREVAQKIHYHQGRLSQFENGQLRPPTKIKKKLAKLFGLQIEELFESDEELKP